ncbi:MAG: ATP-binding cassette domain-containing protein, partial [Duncaniella sp.]|nr:ATP-binding cassette domain-containing protein [Duncaniella sp.]
MQHNDYIIEFLSPDLCFGPVRLTGAQGLGIPAGITAVTGPNGSGKTTLGYVLERGRFGFGNRLRFAREGMRVRMLAFTDIHSFTGVDVLRFDQRMESSENEYVPTVADIFGKAMESELWQDMSARLSLSGVGEKRINYLSSGELRKLLIINALLAAPDILVLDNPFIGLDAPSRAELKDALVALRDRGLNVVLLLCDPEEIPDGTDAVLRLDGCCFVGEEHVSRSSSIPEAGQLRLPGAAAGRAPAGWGGGRRREAGGGWGGEVVGGRGGGVGRGGRG